MAVRGLCVDVLLVLQDSGRILVLLSSLFFLKSFAPHTKNNSCIVGAFINIQNDIHKQRDLEQLFFFFGGQRLKSSV